MRRLMRLAALAIVLAACDAPAARAQSRSGTSVAVFNFGMKSETPEWQWLEKGLADRVITDLFGHEGVTVVQRDTMQRLAQQMTWVPEMMQQPDSLRMINFGLRPKYVVSGVYEAGEGRLQITLTVVDVASQKEVARRVVSGDTAEALNLMRQTSVELLGWLTHEKPENLADRLPAWTRSVPAAKALYEGVDLYDQGRYAEAWLQFRRAGKEDPDYTEAQYWVGRMYYFLNRHEHAQRAYDGFVYRAGRHPRAVDTAREYADTYERAGADRETLLVLYDEMEKRFGDMKIGEPDVFVRDAMRYRAGQVLASEQRYEEAIPLLRPAEGRPPDSRNRDLAEVYMMTCHQLSGHSFGAYDFHRYLGEWLASPERLYFAPGRMEHTISGGGSLKNKGSLYATGGSRATLFSCPGKLFDSVTVFPEIADGCEGSLSLEVRTDCRLLEVTKPIQECRTAGLTMDKLPRIGWLRIVTTYDATTPPTAMRVTATLRDLEEPQGSLSVSCDTTEQFRVEVDGRLGRTGPGLIGLLPPGPHELTFYPINPDGRHQPWRTEATVKAAETTVVQGRLPWKASDPFAGWTAMTMPSPQCRTPRPHGSHGGGRPCIQADDDAIRIVWSYAGDLWVSESVDGSTFGVPTPLPLPVSTAWGERDPSVLKDESGRFVLVFLSDRDATHLSRPYTCWSRDFIHWSAPSMISSRIYNLTGMLQDQGGRYVSMHTMKVPEGGYRPALAHSRDLYNWQVEGPMTGVEIQRKQDVVLQRDDGRYELVYIHTGRGFGGWGHHLGLGRTFVRRHVSADGIHWQSMEQIVEVMTSGEELLALHESGRTTILLMRNAVHPAGTALKVFREKPDATWEISPWFESVSGKIADFAYHKRWGYILTWVCRTGDDTESRLFTIRADSLDNLFRQEPSDTVRKWEAMDWYDYGRLHDTEGREDRARHYFNLVIDGYPGTDAAARAAQRLADIDRSPTPQDTESEARDANR